jgi:hypothetical protein
MSHLTTSALVRQLLMYALAHPNASDSAPGIARWWLDAGQGVNLQALDEALTILVRRGAFAERLAADGRRRYRRIGTDSLLQQLLDETPDGNGGRGSSAAAAAGA